MKKIKIYQVDAFTRHVFHGNPAAVIPLTEWIDDNLMQAIAMENNLAETAFFVENEGSFHLRWFTPVCEVPLCGHATLASAFIIFSLIKPESDNIIFKTLSGELIANRSGDLIELLLPKFLPVACNPPGLLLKGLNVKPREVFIVSEDPNYYACFNTEEDIRNIKPDMEILKQLHPYGVVVTALGKSYDFVSRYFAPSYGIPEDPVTGSIHSALAPFWQNRLGKAVLHAYQLSTREGELFCEVGSNFVKVSGYAIRYLDGEISI